MNGKSNIIDPPHPKYKRKQKKRKIDTVGKKNSQDKQWHISSILLKVKRGIGRNLAVRNEKANDANYNENETDSSQLDNFFILFLLYYKTYTQI